MLEVERKYRRDMEEKEPAGLYDPRKYLEMFYCRIRMPDEQPQLLETLLTKYQEFFAKGMPPCDSISKPGPFPLQKRQAHSLHDCTEVCR